MKNNYISSSVIKRLPRYHRFLGELKKHGVPRISSNELARMMHLTASQIRQDLNCFGGFGQQGYGYSVDLLYDEIGGILGLDTPAKAIMLGVGKLGVVVAENMDFKRQGFELVGAFDVDENIIGKTVSGLTVLHTDLLEEFCEREQPEAAFICVPSSAAEDLCIKLASFGIKGFWNFSHYDIKLELPDAAVENVHFGDSLMRLSYKIKNTNK